MRRNVAFITSVEQAQGIVAALRQRPQRAEGIRDGTVEMRYELVQASPGEVTTRVVRASKRA